MPETEGLMLDVASIEEQLAIITRAITEGSANNISTFFRDLLIRVMLSERKLDEYKRFIPIIYSQIYNSSNPANDGLFGINLGPFTTSAQALLMMLPKEGSIDTSEEGTYNYLDLYKNGELLKRFEIYKESNLGGLIKATLGDIVPERTVLFRLIYAQLAVPRAVIINTSGLYNTTVSNLMVTGETVFSRAPVIEDTVSLATTRDVKVVADELTAFKNKFIITKENAATVVELAETPAGSIVIQVEDD